MCARAVHVSAIFNWERSFLWKRTRSIQPPRLFRPTLKFWWLINLFGENPLSGLENEYLHWENNRDPLRGQDPMQIHYWHSVKAVARRENFLSGETFAKKLSYLFSRFFTCQVFSVTGRKADLLPTRVEHRKPITTKKANKTGFLMHFLS